MGGFIVQTIADGTLFRSNRTRWRGSILRMRICRVHRLNSSSSDSNSSSVDVAPIDGTVGRVAEEYVSLTGVRDYCTQTILSIVSVWRRRSSPTRDSKRWLWKCQSLLPDTWDYREAVKVLALIEHLVCLSLRYLTALSSNMNR